MAGLVLLVSSFAAAAFADSNVTTGLAAAPFLLASQGYPWVRGQQVQRALSQHRQAVELYGADLYRTVSLHRPVVTASAGQGNDLQRVVPSPDQSREAPANKSSSVWNSDASPEPLTGAASTDDEPKTDERKIQQLQDTFKALKDMVKFSPLASREDEAASLGPLARGASTDDEPKTDEQKIQQLQDTFKALKDMVNLSIFADALASREDEAASPGPLARGASTDDEPKTDKPQIEQLQDTLKELQDVDTFLDAPGIPSENFKLDFTTFLSKHELHDHLIEPLANKGFKALIGSGSETLNSLLTWAEEFVEDVSMEITDLKVEHIPYTNGNGRNAITGTLVTTVHAKVLYPPEFQFHIGKTNLNEKYTIKTRLRLFSENDKFTGADLVLDDIAVTDMALKPKQIPQNLLSPGSDFMEWHELSGIKASGLQLYSLKVAWGALVGSITGNPALSLSWRLFLSKDI